MLFLAAVLILLVISAFFSAAETAMTAASRPLMHRLAATGDKRAAMVNDLRAHRERLIGALLLGNNVVNILAAALTTDVLTALFGPAGVVYATIVMTFLVVVFTEVLPNLFFP